MLLGPNRPFAHDVVDADRIQALLGAIAGELRLLRDGPGEGERAEALFRLGDSIEGLVELLNQDVAAHGESLLAQLVVKRLDAYGIGITRSARGGRYGYDGAAYHEYVRRAPAGRWTAEARFRLLTARFQALPPPDQSPGAQGQMTALQDAVREHERFLRDHPEHPRAPRVRFYLAVDTYRIMRAAPTAAAHERRARRLLEEVVASGAGSVEARAAEILLERFPNDPRR